MIAYHTKQSNGRLREFWHSLDSERFYHNALESASQIRENIIPKNKIVVRKTFGLNEAGCSVNCNFCTLAVQYIGESNKNQIVENIKERILNFQNDFPDPHIELVGYWPGINSNSKEFQPLLQIIRSTSNGYNLIGGDLGIILENETLTALKENGLSYIHNNLETNSRLYPFAVGKGTKRLEQKKETLQRAKEYGLKTTSGILIGIGENIDDLIEQINSLNDTHLERIAVNFMDYETNPKIGERFENVREQLTPEYALRVLVFLRNFINPERSLMVGSGVGRYLYNEDNFSTLLTLVDTIHIGSFINLLDSNKRECSIAGDKKNTEDLLQRLDRLHYILTTPNYFEEDRNN